MVHDVAGWWMLLKCFGGAGGVEGGRLVGGFFRGRGLAGASTSLSHGRVGGCHCSA